MKHFLTRNEIFQKPNTNLFHETQERFSVQLRKEKRQACFNSYRKSTAHPLTALSLLSIPPELLEINKNLQYNINAHEKLLSLLYIATREKTEYAVSALKYLNERPYEFEQISNFIPLNIVEDLIYNLRFSKGELQVSTIALIDTIISSNDIEKFFQFNKTKLLPTLIDLLKAGNKQLLPYNLNIIFNYFFSNTNTIEYNSKLLKNLFSTLNNPELATTQNNILVAYIFKQLNLEGVSDDLVLEVSRWLIKFIHDSETELKQTAISALCLLMFAKGFIVTEAISCAEEILNLLECNNNFILKNALSIIQIITAGPDSDTQTLLNLGLLDKLSRILARFWNPGNRLCVTVAQCVSNIYAGTEDQIVFTLSHSPSLINHFLASSDPTLYKEGIFCISNIVKKNSKVATLKLIKSDTLACMFECLCVSNDRETLLNLKSICKVMKRVPTTINPNDWIELIEDLQGKLIYEKISALIEMKTLKNVKIFRKLEKILMIIQQKQVAEINLLQPSVFKFS